MVTLQAIVDLHPGAFPLPLDLPMLQKLFFDSPSQIETLNQYVPCEAASQPRPFLSQGKSALESRVVRNTSGNWYADRVAELACVFDGYYVSEIGDSLTLTEIDHMLYRLGELRRPLQDLVDEEAGKAFAEAEADAETGAWIRAALLQGTDGANTQN